MKTSLLSTLGAALLLAPLTSTTTFAQSTWQTVDDYTSGQSGSVKGLAAVDNGAVFTAGTGSDLAGIPHAFVQRSLDGGQTWVQVLDLPGNAAGGLGTAASWAVTVGQRSGLVFATATLRSLLNNNRNTWVTVRSADGGTIWSTVDDVLMGTNPFGKAVTADPFGRVFTAGCYTSVIGTTSTSHWATRASVDGGSTWTTTDDIAGGSGVAAASDATGNVFTGGAVLQVGVNLATVRKLAVP